MNKHLMQKEDGSFYIQKSKGFIPKGSLGIAPDGEDPAWLQVENVNGETIITVNQPEKERIQAERLEAEFQREQLKAQEKAALDDLKAKSKGFKKADVADLDSIRNEIENIYLILEQLTKGL
jgi:hypothetical protein